jgi:hypothetical protein
MLDLVESIYRYLICDYLKIEKIINLKKTCKTINNDKNLDELIIKKISNFFGYNFTNRYWIGNYNYNNMSNKLLLPIINNFKKITYGCNLEQLEKIEYEEEHNINIVFPIKLFFRLDYEDQIIMIEFLCNKLYELWKYANKNNMDMNQFDYRIKERFRFYCLNNWIKGVLNKIFLKGDNKIRQVILDSLRLNSDKCVNGLYKNKLSVSSFIKQLYRGDISELEGIIEIGLFLTENCNYYTYFHKFIEMNIGTYIEMNDSYEDTGCDYFAYSIRKKLNQKNRIYPDETNKEVLKSLLKETDYTIEQFIRTNNERMERFRNQKPR